jgi:hypothetical protein
MSTRTIDHAAPRDQVDMWMLLAHGRTREPVFYSRSLFYLEKNGI